MCAHERCDGQRENNAIVMDQGDGSWLNIEYDDEQRVRQVMKRYKVEHEDGQESGT